jgi:hypothetical protein
MDVLEQELGETWPGQVRGKEGSVPPEIAWSPAHAVAYAELLEFALRLKLLSRVPGFASVRRDLRRNLVGHRRMHARVQLEVASLAKMARHEVSMEVKGRPGMSPLDVQFGAADRVVAAEAKVIMFDELTRTGNAFADEVNRRINKIRMTHDVEFDGELRVKLKPDELHRWALALESAAAKVSAGSGDQTVAHPLAGTTIVIPGSRAAGATFRFPAETSQGWPRIGRVLRDKANQAIRAGASWLRVDVMDGLWQFSPWARLTLPAKLSALSSAVRDEMRSLPELSGAVVTSGACLAQGVFAEESCEEPDGGIALRRLLDPIRVRETVIVPLTAAALPDADMWAELYRTEPQWLGWALSESGLPPPRDVLAWKLDSEQDTAD